MYYSETACELRNETRNRSRAQGMAFETPEGSRDFLGNPVDNQFVVLSVVSVLRQPRNPDQTELKEYHVRVSTPSTSP